jgi:hypothetical protein
MNILNISIENDKSPKFYQEYPKLFNSYYNIDAEKLYVLSKAGYYYYHSILSLDSLMDDGEFKEIPQILTLQEESIKLLTSIYGVDSSFWSSWNKRKKEYYTTPHL